MHPNSDIIQGEEEDEAGDIRDVAEENLSTEAEAGDMLEERVMSMTER